MTHPALDAGIEREDDGIAEMLAGRRPSSRSRRAEQLAQAVLDPAAGLDGLYALVLAAAETTGAENAHISLLTDRQITVIRQRRNADGVQPLRAEGAAEPALVVPLDESLCSMALRVDDAICIPDARADERVAGLSAVTGGILGSYLGAPIRSAAGLVLGMLCVFNADPYDWTDLDAADLALLADDVAAELDTVLAALTGVGGSAS